VGLVRRLVLGEPGIAVDPEDRPLRIRLERDPALVECICQRADERFHRLLEESLVFRLAWLEPRAVVVLGELSEEVDRFGAEARESVDSDGHGDDLLAALASIVRGLAYLSVIETFTATILRTVSARPRHEPERAAADLAVVLVDWYAKMDAISRSAAALIHTRSSSRRRWRSRRRPSGPPPTGNGS
jgi:hypothetical protein